MHYVPLNTGEDEGQGLHSFMLRSYMWFFGHLSHCLLS